MTVRAFLLAVALAIFAQSPSSAQPHPPTLHLATVEILGFSPVNPLEGKSFKVDYRINNVSLLQAPISGNVRAIYGSARQLQSTNGVPGPVTIQLTSPFVGSFTFTAGAAGTQTVSVDLVSCPPTVRGRLIEACFGRGARVIAHGEADVSAIRDLVHMRVPGQQFIRLDKKDSGDNSKVKSGFLCVEHNPGCGAQGNDGTDGFLPTFPPGAVYEGVDFERYWPEGLTGDIGGFPVNDSGSYGAVINYAKPNEVPPAFPYVRWHNTCLAGSSANNKSVYYSISFKVLVPRGTDLGPDAVSVDQSPISPCSSLPDFGIKVRAVDIKPRDYVNLGSPISIDWQMTTYGNCEPANVTLSSLLLQETRKKIASLPAVRNGSYAVNAPTVPGWIQYFVSAECSGQPSFRSEASHQLEVAMGASVQTFNLTVDGPAITPSPPLIEKKPFSVGWTIRNTGNAAAPMFSVQLYLDDVAEPDSKDVASLSPGNSKSLSWSVTKELVGSPHKLELKNVNGASLGYASIMVIPAP